MSFVELYFAIDFIIFILAITFLSLYVIITKIINWKIDKSSKKKKENKKNKKD